MEERKIITVASHFDEHAISARGQIDAINGAIGIEGWALDLARPNERLALRCVMDEEVLAECETDRPREDVRQLARCHGFAGFRFSSSVFEAAAKLAKSHPEGRITVTIVGTTYQLPFTGPLPTIRELSVLGAPPTPKPVPLERVPLPTDAVLHQAASLLTHPLRAVSENLQGRVEIMSKDVPGELWVGGWMTKGHPLQFPAVLHDGEKHLAAVELAGYDRGDLPAGALAIFGVIRSAWSPRPGAEDLFLFFGEEGRFHIRWNKPLQYRTIDELLRIFEEIRSRCYAGRIADLQRAIASVGNWSQRAAQVAGFAAEAHVDRMLIVPHFGVFLEGWVLSPVKTVDDLVLRIGGQILRLDPNSLYRKRRADLAASFQGPDEFLDRRGFVGAFRGDIPPELATDPVLKVVFTDGTSINHAIDTRIVRRLGHSAVLEDALAFYPNIELEPFFPEFAPAVGRAIRERMARHRPYKVAGARGVLVISLPNSRPDTYLMFDELSRRLGPRWQPPGVAFILGDNDRRTDVIPLFEELVRARDSSFSLFIVPNIDYALYVLPDVLGAVGASRFVYFGPNLFISDRGWKEAAKYLAKDSDELLFLGVDEEPDGPMLSVRSSDCFAWTTAAFKSWIADSPTMIGGFDSELVMPWQGGSSRFRRHAAARSRHRHIDRLTALVNQEALRKRGLIAGGVL